MTAADCWGVANKRRVGGFALGLDARRNVAAIGDDQRRRLGGDDFADVAGDAFRRLLRGPGNLRGAEHLQAVRVDQIQVADQVGRGNVVPGDGDGPVERPQIQLSWSRARLRSNSWATISWRTTTERTTAWVPRHR